MARMFIHPVTGEMTRYPELRREQGVASPRQRKDTRVHNPTPKELKGKAKIGMVMKEFKKGTLRSGSGKKVINPAQAKAIALAEGRKVGAKIPYKGGKNR